MFCILALAAVAEVVTAMVPLDAQLRAIAVLAGEPSIVSAAGLATSPNDEEVSLPTIENRSAFDAASPQRRLVLIGGLDESAGSGFTSDQASAAAVVGFVRWFKTAASSELRREWSVSALPRAPFGPAGKAALERWVTFQAPDLVVEVRDDGGRLGLASIDSMVIGTKEASAAIRKLISARPKRRSALHDTMIRRVAREPLEIARLLANRYPATSSLSYIPAVAWTSSLRLAALTGDERLAEKVRQQTTSLLSGGGALFGNRIQLTAIAGAMVFAELGGEAWARAVDAARLAGARKESGIAEHGQGWTDDMFMAAAILARVGRHPDHRNALDAAARLLTDYAVRLQRPDGIFIHAIEGPFAWGRGNGFAALGLMEVLEASEGLERSEAFNAFGPARSRLLEIFRRQMAGIKAQQAPDGMWRQVIDEAGAYREETATAMLMTSMARGIRRGWISRDYLPAVERAWRGLAAHIAEDGTLVDVCASTGAGPTRRYYLDRPAITGADDRGGAMALLAAVEMHQLRR